MKNTQPTWTQTLLICAFAAAFCFLGYFLSRMRGHWGPSAWLILAALVLVGMGFILVLFFYYLRPQYGAKAFPIFLVMFLGHATLVAVLLKMRVA